MALEGGELTLRHALTTTADGAPFIGSHRNLPGHLFALGFGRHGDGLAWMAAKALVAAFEEDE